MSLIEEDIDIQVSFLLFSSISFSNILLSFILLCIFSTHFLCVENQFISNYFVKFFKNTRRR